MPGRSSAEAAEGSTSPRRSWGSISGTRCRGTSSIGPAPCTVTGGRFNVAQGPRSLIAGGESNLATGGTSSVTGGQLNTATGLSSNVSGGASRTASGDDDWVAGTLFEDN